jgi:MOSC domain-containing protein YiiM
VAAILLNVNLATDDELRPSPSRWAKRPTGIDKRPRTERIQTGHDQLIGDHICNRKHHGGPDQAVYAYAAEDARWWASELSRVVGPGAFGENFTTEGLDVTGAVVGELWAIGSAVFEVSVPRIPCRVFAGFWDVSDLIKRFTRAGRPGAYLRIHNAGEVGRGDRIEVTHRPSHGVTIGETFRALTGDHSLAHRLLQAPQLPEEALASARKWAAHA